MVNLGTVHWKVLLGTKNYSSMASLQKHPFGTFIFKSVVYPKMNMPSFTYPYVVPKLYEFLSSAEHDRGYFEESW